jgi:L-rhamnonate dehydratase
MLTIERIEAFAIRSDIASGPGHTPARRAPWLAGAEIAAPLARHARFKRDRTVWRPKWPAVGCLVTASDGSWGFGVSRYGSPVIAIVNEHFGPLLIGEPALATERLWDMTTRFASPYGAGGLSAYATSAIDLALWDLKGKVLKRPVYELIGGPSRSHVECYATGNDTDWHMELGFRATKLACPHGPADGLEGLDANEALFAKARDLVGPQVEIMLDCWMSMDVEYVVRLAQRLARYQPRWIEDSLNPDDLDGHEALRRRLPGVGLAGGEHWYVPQTFLHAASRRLLDVFQPDIGWAGGLTGLLRIAAIADAAGIAVIPHAGMNTPYGQHFGLAVPGSHMGEFFLGSGVGVPLDETKLFPGQGVPIEGKVTVSDAPGFGLGVDLDGIARMKA